MRFLPALFTLTLNLWVNEGKHTGLLLVVFFLSNKGTSHLGLSQDKIALTQKLNKAITVIFVKSVFKLGNIKW